MVRRSPALQSLDSAREHLDGADDFRDDVTGDTGGPSGGDGDAAEAEAKPKRRGRRKVAFAKTNGYDPEKLKSYVDRLDRLNDELEEQSGALRKDMKEVYEEAADQAGIPTKLLKLVYRQHRFELKRQKKIAELESDERQNLEQLEAALGSFKDTPLGEAALAAAAE